MAGKGLTNEEAAEIYQSLSSPWVLQMGLQMEHVGGMDSRIRMPLNADHYRVGKIISGQTLLALIDLTMMLTISGHFGGYRNMATINQSTNFLKPISDADIIATGRLLRVGKTMAFGEVLLAADGGAPAVQAQSSYALLPDMPLQPAGA